MSKKKTKSVFRITTSPHFPVILGMDWLAKENHVIDWSTATVNLQCQKPCPSVVKAKTFKKFLKGKDVLSFGTISSIQEGDQLQ